VYAIIPGLFVSFLSRLTLKNNPLDLYLLSSWDYKYAPPLLAKNTFFSRISMRTEKRGTWD
jgi:hypothetical protein